MDREVTRGLNNRDKVYSGSRHLSWTLFNFSLRVKSCCYIRCDYKSLCVILFQELAVGPQQIPMLNSGSRWTWETEWRLQQWPRREDMEALTG